MYVHVNLEGIELSEGLLTIPTLWLGEWSVRRYVLMLDKGPVTGGVEELQYELFLIQM